MKIDDVQLKNQIYNIFVYLKKIDNTIVKEYIFIEDQI